MSDAEKPTDWIPSLRIARMTSAELAHEVAVLVGEVGAACGDPDCFACGHMFRRSFEGPSCRGTPIVSLFEG